MKRPASQESIVAKKCKIVASAIKDVDLPDRLKSILASTTKVTVGQLKATRHPFNERFVQKIGEVLEAHKDVSEKDIVAKEAALTEMAPTKGVRETVLEEAKATMAQKTEALESAKQAVKDNAAKCKEVTAQLEAKKKEQKSGDKDINDIEKRKALFEDTEQNSFVPLVDGTADPEAKKKMLKAVMSAAKEFKFDSTLMEASVKVLEKTKEERGASFDEVCLDQLKDAFKTSIAALDAQLAEGGPAKAARATAVEEATTAKAAAEKEQEELIAAFTTTKDEKDAAVEAVKAASKHLNEFIPDIQKAGDVIGDAKASLKNFVDGPLASFNELKDLTEDTFKVVEPEPVLEVAEEAPAPPATTES